MHGRRRGGDMLYVGWFMSQLLQRTFYGEDGLMWPALLAQEDYYYE